jgi:hypothetical protein
MTTTVLDRQVSKRKTIKRKGKKRERRREKKEEKKENVVVSNTKIRCSRLHSTCPNSRLKLIQVEKEATLLVLTDAFLIE